jgi:NADPH:quinone reductase
MRAVVIEGAGGPEVLSVREVATPEPGAEQVRVRVRAAGLNRADILQRRGQYPAPPGSPADIPGMEFAGEVDATGPGVRDLELGQRIYGICGGGAQAEYIVTHERLVARIPDRLDWHAAGGVPEVFMTVHDALFTQAGLGMGESVLIHAVGSGIGTTAIQLARAAGARTLGTSRTPEKLERAQAIGLDVGLAASGFADTVREATGGAGVDVILDVVGGPYLADNLAALAVRGRMIVLAALGGGKAPLPIGLLMSKRARLLGSVLRARSLEEKIEVTRAFARHVNPLLADGRVRPIIDRVFDLGEVAAAHEYLESDASFGKVVLAVR